MKSLIVFLIACLEMLSQVPQNEEILIIGDSQACAMKFGAIPAVKRSNENVEVVCKGGTRTAWWEGEKMNQALSQKKYDAVIIFLGSNDYGGKPDPSKLVQQVQNSGAACVWVGPPLIRNQRTVTNDHLKSTVPPCTYLDSQALGVPLADGVHPTGPGSVMWLRKAWELKDSIIKSRQSQP